MNIFIPIETINRELDTKIVLASFLVKLGATVYIGQHDYLHSLIPYFKNGLYIGKNIFKKPSDKEDSKRLFGLKKQGINVFYIHEEGAVFLGGKEDWKKVLEKQYSTKGFDANDTVLTWGDFQKNFDSKRTKSAKVVATGHPRFDLYKEKYRAYFNDDITNLNEKYGDYILVNGNYGLVNHGQGLDYVFSESVNYDPNDVEQRLSRVGYYKNSSAQMNAIIELVHHLAVNFKDKNIVYRSHPSESDNLYNIAFQGVSNIHVIHDGGVAPWILAADVIIHDGCTTAIEAFISGKKIINYKVACENEYNIWLPNQLGFRSESIADVITIIKEKDLVNEELPTEVTELLCNFYEDSIDSIVEMVSTHIEKYDKSTQFISPSTSTLKSKYVFTELKNKLSSIRHFNNMSTHQYHNKKFNGFSEKDVLSKFSSAFKISGAKVDVDFHNKLMFSASESTNN